MINSFEKANAMGKGGHFSGVRLNFIIKWTTFSYSHISLDEIAIFDTHKTNVHVNCYYNFMLHKQ